MIQGIGIDLVEIDRIRKAAERTERFLARIYTEKEIAYCSSKAIPWPSYAGRFAAKEAIIKAFGQGISWQEMEILPDENGKPLVTLHGKVLELAGGAEILISISHIRDFAVAQALIQDKPRLL